MKSTIRIACILAVVVAAALPFSSCKKDNSSAEDDSSELNGYEAVDLGLSVKWATCNVGADSPEECGYYFAWGETSPKDNYSLSSYRYYDPSDPDNKNMKKYNPTDDKIILEKVDDAAYAYWRGSWRMPTRLEFIELIENCTWVWDDVKKGYTVTSTINDNSIFLPAAGRKDENGLSYVKECGYYWPSTRSYYCLTAPNLCFQVGAKIEIQELFIRNFGFSVRPVIE